LRLERGEPRVVGQTKARQEATPSRTQKRLRNRLQLGGLKGTGALVVMNDTGQRGTTLSRAAAAHARQWAATPPRPPGKAARGNLSPSALGERLGVPRRGCERRQKCGRDFGRNSHRRGRGGRSIEQQLKRERGGNDAMERTRGNGAGKIRHHEGSGVGTRTGPDAGQGSEVWRTRGSTRNGSAVGARVAVRSGQP
jgi:hypothetical protein